MPDIFLDDIFRELNAADSDDLRLTISGEAIARLNEQLNKAKEGSDEAYDIANRILILTEIHTNLLGNTEQRNDAPVTLAGELCFILSKKINPEKLPQIYVGSLLSLSRQIVQLTLMIGLDDNSELSGHLKMIAGLLWTLTATTFDEFSQFADLSIYNSEIVNVRKFLGLFDDTFLIHNEVITPRKAIDVFYDIIARFCAMGLIDQELLRR